MNKYLFILGLVGTVFLSACSASDDLMTGLSSDEERAIVVEAGRNSEVPISLGSFGNRGRGLTRAPLNSDDGTLLFETPADENLGVYCLARGKQADAPVISDIPTNDSGISWKNTRYAKWLDNAPAKVVRVAASGGLPAYSDVQFVDDGGNHIIKYYPYGNWYYYDFYAYYPRITTMSETDDIIIADYTITGKEDIIHAKATSDDYINYDPDNNDATDNSVRVNAFSSKYFRLKNDGATDLEKYNNLPNFTFDHKLTQLYFKVKAATASDAQKLRARGITLKSLKIKNCYTGVRLFVASRRDAPLNSGALAVKTDTSGEIEVWTGSAGSESHPTNLEIAVNNTDTEAHDVGYLMVPPSELIDKDGIPTANRKYVVSLEMNPDGVPNTELTLDISGGFLKGQKYTITIEVYAPDEILARATLNQWDEGDGDENKITVPTY